MNATLLSVQYISYSIISLVLQRELLHQSIAKRSEWLDSYHYIVVGSGSAGAIVAKRLAEDPRVKVLLLEAGGPQSIRTDMPTLYPTFLGSEYDWNYLSEPQKYMGLAYIDKKQTEPRGKVIGGTSTINYMVYNRGNRRDYDRWATEFGARGWNYDQVLPFFKKSENNTDYELIDKNPGYHGTGGPIGVLSKTNLSPVLQAYQRVLNQLDLETIDLNGKKQLGTGLIQFTIKNDIRSGTANEFLLPNIDKQNIHILCYTHVIKILFSGKTAVGVEFMRYGNKYKVYAELEVIVSAGAVGSAQLLMLSGIGPKAHLQSLNISVVSDIAVGEHLKDHVVVPFYFLMKNDTTLGITPELTPDQFFDFFNYKRGSLVQFPKTLTYYSTEYNDEEEYPDTCIYAWIESYLSDVSKMVLRFPKSVRNQWKDYYKQFVNRNYFYAAVSVVKIQSEGYIRLKSTDPFEHPIIDPKYLSAKQDFEAFVDVIKFFYYVIEMTPFSKYVYIPRPIPGCDYCPKGPLFLCDLYIRCVVRQIGLRDYHLGGSCRMGSPNRSDTVVDERLRVKNIKNLRVIDTSVMSDMVNANTQAVAMMIGEKGAHIVREDNKHIFGANDYDYDRHDYR